MVLWIDQSIVDSLSFDIEEIQNHFSFLRNSTNNFCNEEIVKVDKAFSLYVNQAEYAIIPANDDTIKVIGSDSATTCHIIILKNSIGDVAVIHCDGKESEDEALKFICSKLSNGDKKINAYVAGGFAPTKSSSKKEKTKSLSISKKIFTFLLEESFHINLCLWCTLSANTSMINGNEFPRFYGLAIDRTKGKVFPAEFPEQVPNYILRSASFMVNQSSDVHNIYDSDRKIVSVYPFSGWERSDYDWLARLPDNVILKYFSTSPMVEPPSFCQKMRQVFSLLHCNTSEDLFPNMCTHEYKMNSSGIWENLVNHN